jgi:hypothetical protein
MNLKLRAKQLYDACPTVKPNWEQLSDTTQSVWIEMAANEAKKPAMKPAKPSKFAKYIK